ncbi:hypothetical protein [Methanobacterium alcaliphilum]|uniref:hypothetical protein n=1 Tax=Methanobacterium alcaliphilum TaxID=392018 RepID=UPI00200A6BBA|nr:hypothetical protein [Methanobacterium alcaliphilum]MCK9150493.1 hypothetical protein [Methanobacterium alcaliphilum]
MGSNNYYDLAVNNGLEEEFTWNSKAFNYLNLEDYRNATLFFKKHLKENPVDADSWFRLGYCLPFLK